MSPRHHVLIDGSPSPLGELAAVNVELMLGLLSDAPLRLASRSEPSGGELTVQRCDRPFGSQDLVADVELAGSWRHSGSTWDSHFPVDVIGWTSYILERREEYSGPSDEHGRFVRSASIIERAGLGHIPALDLMVDSLREFIINAATLKGVRVERQSPWPSGKRFALALSHDIDYAQDVSRLAALAKVGAAGHATLRGHRELARRRLHDARGLVSSRGTSPYWLMNDMRGLEVAQGIDSTYFVLPHTSNRVAEGDRTVRRYDVGSRQVREMLRSLSESGAELALHTTYDSATTLTGVSEDLDLLREALPVGVPIRGARNHYLRSFVAHSVRAVQQAGLEWDSSLGWANGWGFRTGTTMPLRAGETGPAGIWQLGLELMDVAVPMRDFISALGDLLLVAAKYRGAVNVLVHPSPFDNATAHEHLDFYEEVVALIAGQSDCWVATGSSIVDAMERYAARVAPSVGED